MMLNSELSFEQLITLYPEQIWLEISPEERDTAQRQTNAQRYTNDTARERAFQNTLCLNAIAAFLAEEPDLPDAEIWLEPSDRPAVWELVNGSILTVGTTRLAIVPTDAAQFDALKVEQEWIDIPDWAAHYYLAVQLNLEANWLRIVGYATHDQLKHSENFSNQERVYCLSRSHLIEDLNVMWMAREVSPDWNPIVAPLPELAPTTATDLINQLGQITAYSPRLERSFAQWAALVVNSGWWRSLHQRRLAGLTPIAHLSRWLQDNVIEPGWQVVQDWTNFPQLATAKAPGSEQTRKRSITLGQQSFDLIVVPEVIETGSDLRITLILQHLETTPLSGNLYLTVAEQTETDQLVSFDEETLAVGSSRQTLQLSFVANRGDRILVTIALAELQASERFLI